jgi:hypothetical protein
MPNFLHESLSGNGSYRLSDHIPFFRHDGSSHYEKSMGRTIAHPFVSTVVYGVLRPRQWIRCMGLHQYGFGRGRFFYCFFVPMVVPKEKENLISFTHARRQAGHQTKPTICTMVGDVH